MSPEFTRRNLLAAAAATAGVVATQAVIWEVPASAASRAPSVAAGARRLSGADSVLDTIVFGDSASETVHALIASESSVVGGALGQSARTFMPKAQPGWWGGSALFTVNVDPAKTTYVTAKLWGGDAAGAADDSQDWRLQLFVDGKAVGWYDEGPVDNLDLLGLDPRSPGRFFLHTLPLPEAYTQGKSSLQIEVRSMGRIFAYGGSPDSFFYDQTTPSRPIYRVYTHTDPYFEPADGDEFGTAPTVRTRPNQDQSTLADVRAKVLAQHDQLIYGGGAYTTDAWGFNELAEAYQWKDSSAYQNPDALVAVCAAIDGRHNAWKADGAVLSGSDQQWQGFGRVGLTLAYLWDDLQSELDRNVSAGYTSLVNAGFEQGGTTPLGWFVQGWASQGTMSRDISVYRSGSASLKVVSNGGSVVVSPNGYTLVGSGGFFLSGWIKTDGTATSPKLDVLFFDDANKLVGTDHNFFAATGTSDWQQVGGAFSVPTGATRFQIWAVVSSGETAWFDDITFQAAGPGNLQVVNAGFEAGGATPFAWAPQPWANNGTLARDTTQAHSGTASARLTSTGGSIVVGPAGRTKVAAGQFTVSAWLKTNGLAASPKIDVLFWDATGKLAGGDHNFFAAPGTTGWQQVTGTFTIPDGAVEFEVWMVVANGESAWFDDISVTAPPPAGSAVTRRAAYTDMLLSSRDYWKQNMRHYTNQAQITAIGIYQANRGLSLISPSDAWPESRARQWLYESLGMAAWLGPELPDGTRTRPLGADYYVVTPKGLTRELGYVGNYGEVTDWLVMMYESVTRGHAASAAPEIRDQMLTMIHARGYFRHFDVDADGYRVARLETVIGWRNEVYPGEIAYAQRTAWDSSPVMAPAVFADPKLVGWTQEMIADGQFAPQLSLMLTNSSTRVGLNATRMLARDLPAFEALAASGERMPVNWDAPDFVFTDEADGAIAVKNGQEILFASLYWRARQGINDWGRVHLVTPTSQLSATVRERTQGSVSSDTFTVQDWTTWDYAINNSGQPTGVPGGGWAAPGDAVHQAYAGEVLPVAMIPGDAHPALGSTELGVEEVMVGIAPYYQLQYGRYLVGMNTTSDQTFRLASNAQGTARVLGGAPKGFHGNSSHVPLARGIEVPPQSTVVLHLNG
ncbi:hypothetical protein [Leifsonia sp. 2MCAF36]|uniref:hypothetical protein n=1 Tax=Leifsonia sp. 2MCAF36 TaxID=3232988 RepID=UPI003F947E26